MKRKSFKFLLYILIVTFLQSAIFASTPPAANAATSKTKTITIGYIAMPNASPQALINTKRHTFEYMLKQKGVHVKWVVLRSLDVVWPMMDKGQVDFIYLPVQNFSTYITETSEFGGSDKYRIIAGSLNHNWSLLAAKPKIQTLKDLDGKTVGIVNHNYAEEMYLNKQLESVGLKTKALGGTVEVEYTDWMGVQWNNFADDKYAAITTWTSAEGGVLKKVPEARTMMNLNSGYKFGKLMPNKWFVAKKELIDRDSELVKLVLKAHIKTTELGISKKYLLHSISKEVWDNYWTVKLKQKVYTKYPEAFFKREWYGSQPTYDPNMKYIKENYDFLIKAGYLKNKTMDNFVDLTLLNQVLKEQGRPAIK